jgi:hypothetical protein
VFSGFRSSLFIYFKTDLLFQVLKAWASGRLRGTRPLPQRPDSFLERVAMGGANESRSHTPERRTRKISDIKYVALNIKKQQENNISPFLKYQTQMTY